ncbi:PH domain-containing protein [Syntrophaceticus schinkii]|jgi:uncharacterized membrane protein YdbT with pleckstrin-like domain|uniref:Uncharacterized protein YyaB-like PH domain-containing protein n=1 Tax=Syntrophaceticus schinkii TaxID=499207 RepID=A0A0B7MC58_9FIRM|nr:PH domain-containing protein [Syntrophaceticus schinkii]CEO88129.1 conserved hypothetical protein [Syntrophaceticus schinkii]
MSSGEELLLMHFQSKKDLWLGILIWSAMLLPIWFVVQDQETWPFLFIFIPSLAFCGWIWFGTGYTITDKTLEVRCGPFYEKIPLGKIRRVQHTSSLQGGAALSLDRLEIKYSGGVTLVSPLDSFAFVLELKQRCPNAEFEGL